MKKIALISSAILLMIAIVGLFSCAKKDATAQYKTAGKVINTTWRPVADADVKLIKSGESDAKYSTKTNSSGEYDFGKVDNGEYDMVITASGYNQSKTYFVADQDVSNEDQVMNGNANVSGSVIDSQTGDGLANATVGFNRDPSQTTNENAELLVNTDESGIFNITDGPTGGFTGLIEADGYFTRTIEEVDFVDGENHLDQQTVVQQPEEGDLRIILTWGEDPYDLDSHLSGPASTGRFHGYYWVPNYGDAVNLDVDDVNSFGPETITIKSFVNGMYRYSIHNYSEQSPSGGAEIYNSPTLVEVYDYNSLIKSYTAPPFTGNGNTWRVFEINVSGSTITFTDINTYVQASSSGDGEIFNIIDDKKDLMFYLDEL